MYVFFGRRAILKQPSKTRSRGGYTLVELLVALLLIAVFSAAAVVGVSVARRSSEASVLESRFLVVSDTINTSVRDILLNSYYDGIGEDGSILFTCEKYSGWLMSLDVEDGRLIAIIHDKFDGDRSELLLNSASYAEFEVADGFEIGYSDGVYTCVYALVSGDFRKEVSIDIPTLNK